MLLRVRNFLKDQAGAVSIDWVVLTGALVGLGFGLISVFASSTGDVGDQVSSRMSGMGVGAAINF